MRALRAYTSVKSALRSNRSHLRVQSQKSDTVHIRCRTSYESYSNQIRKDQIGASKQPWKDQVRVANIWCESLGMAMWMEPQCLRAAFEESLSLCNSPAILYHCQISKYTVSIPPLKKWQQKISSVWCHFPLYWMQQNICFFLVLPSRCIPHLIESK